MANGTVNLMDLQIDGKRWAENRRRINNAVLGPMAKAWVSGRGRRHAVVRRRINVGERYGGKVEPTAVT